MQPDWQRIQLENRDVSIRSCRFLGQGWNSIAYLVNNELVFRFPRHATQWEELKREVAFLSFAADQLPTPVPRYVKVAPDSPAAAWGYAVYRYVPGEPMDVRALSPRQREATADLLAAFLRALHGLRPDREVDAMLPRENPRAVAEEYLEAARREIAPRLAASEARVLLEQFEGYLAAPENFAFQSVVIHADFSRDHILLDSGSVAGVIDFGDVNWGDPDYDFMYLLVDSGSAFVNTVAQRYGHPDLEGLSTKLRYFALVDQVDTILEGAGLALEGQKRDAWRRLEKLGREQDCV